MDPTKTPVIPPELEQVRQGLEQWRSTQAHRSPIPEALWGGGRKTGPTTWRSTPGAHAAPGLRPPEGPRETPGATQVGCSFLLGSAPSGAGLYRAAGTAARQFASRSSGIGRAAREDEGRIQGHRHSEVGGAEPGAVGRRDSLERCPG